jgi:hypothetical protein
MYNKIGKNERSLPIQITEKEGFEMIDTSHAVIAYGSVVEVYSRNGSCYGFIANSDPPHRMIFFHENQRGVYVNGDYQMPVIMPILDKFSGPTIRMKNPDVGDLAAYYLGFSERGPLARVWCLVPTKKPAFKSTCKVAAAKG